MNCKLYMYSSRDALNRLLELPFVSLLVRPFTDKGSPRRPVLASSGPPGRAPGGPLETAAGRRKRCFSADSGISGPRPIKSEQGLREEQEGCDTEDVSPNNRLEELVLRQRDELLELLSVCRGCLPTEDLPRLTARLEFLEGLVRLEADRELRELRSKQKREQAQMQSQASPRSAP